MLRQQVEKIKQSAYENPREFGLHFSNAVGQAYTMTQQAVDVVQERLVAQFINGLRNVVVRHQVYLGSPKILAAAIEMTSTTAGAFQLADVERKGEPMDVGAIGFVTTKPVQPQLSEVAESITALRHELTATAWCSTNSWNGTGTRLAIGMLRTTKWMNSRMGPYLPDHSNLTCYWCGPRPVKLWAARSATYSRNGSCHCCPTDVVNNQENSGGHQTGAV